MTQRVIARTLLALYSAILITVMVFRYLPVIRIGHMIFRFGGVDANGQANLIPFATILPYVLGRGGLVISTFNIVGNIAILVPFGFLLAWVYQGITWKKAFLVAVATGFIIEVAQVIFRTGIFDIDDVILNGLGVMIGFWIYVLARKVAQLG